MPENIIFTLSLIIALALLFDFINGFHDTANAVATSIATGALSPRTAIILATALNFSGALSFTGVAENIAGNLIPPCTGAGTGLQIITAALISAIIWNLTTWYYGLPSSSSHALFGSLGGAAFVATGGRGINPEGFQNALAALLISPPLAFLAGFWVMTLFHLLFFFQLLPRANRPFLFGQRIAAAFQAFSHGSNDAQKTMGVITLALVMAGVQDSLQVPLWVKSASAGVIALGTAAGGWRIIQTVATGITRLAPANGLAADLSSALTIFPATLLHLPVSTTHVISSAIIGVGASSGRRAVKWSTVARMLLAWTFTLPATVFLGTLVYFLIWQ